MEDNEFEEVTIISHTDRPHRVFSEKSIEKLKEQISLEIVKEISGTEDKTYSDDPRLAPGLRELEKLKQDHFGEGEGQINGNTQISFISRLAGESGQYLLGADRHLIFARGQDTKKTSFTYKVRNACFWGNRLLAAMLVDFPVLYDLSVQDPQKLAVKGKVSNAHNLQSTESFLYLKGQRGQDRRGVIIRLNKDLQMDTIEECSRDIIDFFVCPKTETITTLFMTEDDYFLRRNDNQLKLTSQSGSIYVILKKMYSDHFLVGETLKEAFRLHLHALPSLQLVDRVERNSKAFRRRQNIRLLAPRQGIS